MSKKKHVPPPAKPMQKMTGSKVTRDHDRTSASFRHCRPKRDWDAPPADKDVSSIKEVSAQRAR